MKRVTMINYLAGVCVAMSLVACEGPAGPSGADGTDSNESCIKCHDKSTEIKARTDQYLASVHGMGETSARSESASCSPCHSHEGFVFDLENDSAISVPGATQPGCRTCHLIHTNYDSTDFELRTVAAVTLDYTGEVFDHGKGNLCANCHQCRVPSPNPLTATSDSLTIKSSRWGIHHGPQSALVEGVGGFTSGGFTSFHSSLDEGCVSCHMAAPYGSLAGGHTMAMSYDDHGTIKLRTNACTTCHSDADALTEKIEGLTESVETKVATLEALLVAKSFITINSDGSFSINASSDTPLKIPLAESRALMNYILVEEDRSGGIHNPEYTIAILDEAIATLN